MLTTITRQLLQDSQHPLTASSSSTSPSAVARKTTPATPPPRKSHPRRLARSLNSSTLHASPP